MHYNPALDCMRAFAMLAVLLFHCDVPGFAGGFLGVDVFFVLSGYLITTLLSKEIESSGTIDIYRFYRNRLLRLYPALLAMLAAFLIFGRSWFPDAEPLRWAVMAALYVTDYTRAFMGVPTHSIAFTWSLSVEEHYYLIWPVVLPLVLRSKSPARVLLLAYIAATCWRIGNFYTAGWDATYYRFDTRFSGMIMGSLIAVSPKQVIPKKLASFLIGASAFAISTSPVSEAGGITVSIIVVELGSAAAILMARATDSGQRQLLAPLAWLGRISYPMYLWHSLFSVTAWAPDDWVQKLLITAPLALAAATATHYLIERPLRRYRLPATRHASPA